jgi:hypothetical protein
MRRTVSIALTALAFALLPAAAQAATPFTAGSGEEPSVAVGSDGTGHVAWVTTEENVKVGYCRVSPGAEACNRAELLSFAISADANNAGRATVFAPAPNKVVIVAGCWNCPSGIVDRTYRWISTDNGATFEAPGEVDNGFETNGFGAWLEGPGVPFPGIFVGASNSHVKAQTTAGGEGVQYATGGIFVYGPQVVRVPGTTKLVAATNDLEEVRYGVYNGTFLTVPFINTAADWETDKTLSGAEGDNSDTSLNAGPNGVTLAYEEGQSVQARVGLRRFDPSTNTFGGPTYVQGGDGIDQDGLQEPDSFQDPSGRIHVAWSSLYDGGRLRYVVSDTAGNNFSAAATLARGEGFNEPELAAGGDGRGFATWTPGISGPIRVVPLDPQAESATTTPPVDSTPPAITGFGISDRSLTPGQSARFTFNASEAGLAVLTFEKRFLGIKGKKKGRKACLPRTKKRLAALRRRAGSPAALKALLKKKKCVGYRKVGEIRQKVAPGRNTIEFNGKIAGRPLAPGAYRALLVVTDAAGLVSRTESVSFKVVGKKKKRKRR